MKIINTTLTTEKKKFHHPLLGRRSVSLHTFPIISRPYMASLSRCLSELKKSFVFRLSSLAFSYLCKN